MNATEIDEVLDAFIAGDMEKILKFADVEIIDKNVENYTDEDVEKIFKSVTTKIEQGDFDYFYSKIYDERCMHKFFMLFI